MRISDWSSDVCSSDLFFLLLWLLNVTTDEQKKGIADYFSPASISRSLSGAGGVLGGRTIIEDGGKISSFGLPTVVTGPSSEKSDQQIGRASCREGVCQYV